MIIRSILLTFCILMFAACSSNKTSDISEEKSDVPEAMKSKVLVTMMNDRTAQELEQSFLKYELKHLAIASRSQNQHLFQFNSSKISTADLLKKLNRSKMVYLAEALEYKMTKAEMMQSAPKKKVDVK